MPQIACTTSCYFSEEGKLFNKGESYNVSTATWSKMQKVGMAKYFSVPTAEKQAVAPAAPESQGK